jgi:hypothetical protein
MPNGSPSNTRRIDYGKGGTCDKHWEERKFINAVLIREMNIRAL